MNNYSKELFVDRLIQINGEHECCFETQIKKGTHFMCPFPNIYLRLPGDNTVNIMIVKKYGPSKMCVYVCLLLLFEKIVQCLFRVKPAHRRFT